MPHFSPPQSSTPKQQVRALITKLSATPVLSQLIFGARDRLIPKTYGTWFVCNVAAWKQPLLEAYLKSLGAPRVEFVSRDADEYVLRHQFCGQRDETIIIWGAAEPYLLMQRVARRKLPCWRLEDGFLRSVGLGARHIPPASLILDRTGGIYYRADRASALEDFLSNHTFTDAERQSARAGIARVRAANITKYNLVEEDAGYAISPDERNILVFGQCEDDESIAHGSPKIRLNTALLDQVIADHPGCRIFYRPHPDVVAGLRPALSDVRPYAGQVTIMDRPYPVWQNIALFERVCVITSLAGFEALLRERPVSAYGLPFYAGWGLTKDFVATPRRTRVLSLEEVFYGAYLAAPDYIVPETGELTSFDQTVARLESASAS